MHDPCPAPRTFTASAPPQFPNSTSAAQQVASIRVLRNVGNQFLAFSAGENALCRPYEFGGFHNGYPHTPYYGIAGGAASEFDCPTGLGDWYNRNRTHQGLAYRTPDEVSSGGWHLAIWQPETRGKLWTVAYYAPQAVLQVGSISLFTTIRRRIKV